MNKRAYSSTASEGAASDSSLLETSFFDTPKEPKHNQKSNKKKTDKVTSGQKIITEFVTTKQNEIQPNRSKPSSIEKRLDEICSKLSNVLTKDDTGIIRKIIIYTVEELKEKLLGSVVKQIETIESNMFDQAKELASLKEKLNEKKQGDTNSKQEHRLAGADRSSIFFLKVEGLSFSITKEGGVE
ncbi:hypothetical protein DPMN_021686 [Dreissena polymorpha]|uniref:Uncharacterized protein n=1 Tax=Dreissena polymorpha TaxID=45954 RepID=A0A9D4NJ05_DREPO|nr:hypothetical protein DPMN_021686 [Dreissena polymorpha]